MKQTLSSRDKVRSLCRLSAYLCFALILSYLESILPVGSLIPIPGFKLGLANIIVILCFYGESPTGALAVSLSRIFISAILFGNLSSLLFSLCGGILSFVSIIISAVLLKNKVSFIGLSVIAAVSHNVGQFICSVFYVGSVSAFSYFPALVVSGIICGTVTGIILCVLPQKIFFKKEFKKENEELV